MNLKEMFLWIQRVNRAVREIGIGILLLILSPMVLITLCVIRTTDHMEKVNLYGIGWILFCAVFALVFGGTGVYRLTKQYKRMLKVSQGAWEYAMEWRERVLHNWYLPTLLSVMLCILSAVPLISISIIRPTNRQFVSGSYIAVFLFAGMGISIAISIGIRYILVKKSHFFKMEGEIEEYEVDKSTIHKKRKRKIALYWLIIVALAIAIEVTVKDLGSSIGFLLLASMSFLLWFVMSNPFGKWTYLRVITKRKKVMKFVVAVFMVVGIFLVMSQGTWYIQPYISTIPSIAHRELSIEYDEQDGIYSIKNETDEDMKVLQLTDIHLGGSLLSYSKDLKALEAVYTLIERVNPDFVIVTGDFVFPLGIQSFSFNNYTPMLQFATFMRNVGIPWAFTYGNHDTEMIASHSTREIDELLQTFSYANTKTLLYTEVQPAITGRSNQVILIKNKDGSINQALYLLDSNSYVSGKINDYDYIHEDQVQWYKNSIEELSKQEGKLISSLLFTHMPLQEFKTAYELYQSGSDEVTYYSGINGEGVCCSDYPSSLFDTMLDLGSTKGVFVGHDHYNNSSLEYKGIRLTYGMSIDYLAMPGISKQTKQRGATLITLHQDSSFEVEQIPLEK